MSNEAGGEDVVGHSYKDHMNFCYKLKIKAIEGGDSQVVYDKLQDAYYEDPNFFFRIRTNRYNLICAPFVGINNHCKNTMFACAFLGDEKTESFVWLFETFKKAMGDKSPITLFTDQDAGMARVFPSTRYRLCLWHLMQNAVTQFGVLKSDSTFKAAFNKCLSGCLHEAEFNACWEAMRSESTNNVVGFRATKKTSLTEFYHIFQEIIKRWRRTEDVDEFNTTKSIPTSHYPMTSLLKHGAQVYTHTLFRDFEEEFNLVAQVQLIHTNGPKMIYQVYLEDRVGSAQSVMYDPPNEIIICPCKNFEESGWLCFHCICVLHMNPVQKNPRELCNFVSIMVTILSMKVTMTAGMTYLLFLIIDPIFMLCKADFTTIV
ncbi:protein FAR1-RELATED SEQUENCE 5-like [Spinacia oleracea]|uniref:Protein FAR1-RELATED SEQUENCE 5-like n=1 Tax=Spinacia oleracea TaxID=3562 RepID=A0ABM3QY95_SPIOL|nr:protein FAR1-RELATED SEQUENCE 5-like [Spinacia oleracea]